MSLILKEFVEVLGPRVAGVLRGTARLDVTGEGSVMLDETGAREGSGEADVVLAASAAVFRAIFEGRQNPVMAVMGGKLKVDGSPQRALKIGTILTGA